MTRFYDFLPVHQTWFLRNP